MGNLGWIPLLDENAIILRVSFACVATEEGKSQSGIRVSSERARRRALSPPPWRGRARGRGERSALPRGCSPRRRRRRRRRRTGTPPPRPSSRRRQQQQQGGGGEGVVGRGRGGHGGGDDRGGRGLRHGRQEQGGGGRRRGGERRGDLNWSSLREFVMGGFFMKSSFFSGFV